MKHIVYKVKDSEGYVVALFQHEFEAKKYTKDIKGSYEEFLINFNVFVEMFN